MRDLQENRSQWPNLYATIRSLNTFSSSITNYQVFKDLLSSITYENGENPSAMHGVLQKSVEFIKWKYMAFLCAYDCGYNAWPTRCNVSRERSTLRVPLSSFFTYDKRLWNWYLCNNSIGFDNPRCMWKLVVYRRATLYTLWHRANLWAKVWVLYRTEF